MKVKDLSFKPVLERKGINRGLVKFDNGYTVSVITGERHEYRYYVTPEKPYALGIIADDDVVYDMPITDGVRTCLTEDEVNKILSEIEALPKRKG